MGLKASAATLPHILEIGFGTGLNALLTLETAGLEQRPVHYTGIELYPLSWEEVDVLHYSDNPLFKELHTAPWHKDVNITPYFTLHKIQGDVNKVMSDKQSAMSDRLPVHHSSLTTNRYLSAIHIYDCFVQFLFAAGLFRFAVSFCVGYDIFQCCLLYTSDAADE